MSHDNSLFDYDAGYYELMPGRWLSGKLLENCPLTFSKEAVEKAVQIPLQHSDCIFEAYPKTGQTWTLQMINLILKSEEIAQDKEIDTSNFFWNIPFIEAEFRGGKFGADFFCELDQPRYLKTHLPFQLWEEKVKSVPNVKVIQNIRDPKDQLVSYYHHNRSDESLGAFHGSWDEYFQLFKEKKLAWGDYFEHTSQWYKFNKDREDSLVLFYEEMKKDPRGHLIKIAKFLGFDLSDKVIDTILELSSFKTMSKTMNEAMKNMPGWKSERSQFIRKGQVGGWAEVFSQEQKEYMDAQCKEYLEPLGIKY